MATSKPVWPVKPYSLRHQAWPYKESDFSRQDPSSDSSFYRAPRFVTHIDDAAISTLKEYYADVLPTSGKALDFCSSWISHFPASVEQAIARDELKAIGMGMNQAELEANDVLKHGRLLVDLNIDPDVSAALVKAKVVDLSDPETLIDASTVVVSIDYLIQPVEVLSSVLKVTKPGGKIHLTISNRCFPTKAINRWLRISEEERLQMVGDFLHFAGWKDIELVELSNGKDAGQPSSFVAQDFRGLMSMIGMNSRDPLWVVRATKA
jgi:SAM-dependent methyltransferase